MFDEARISPKPPFSSITRAPFTVMMSVIARPARRPPSAFISASRAARRSTTPYFSVSGQKGERVGVIQVRLRSRSRSAIDRSGLASSRRQISTAVRSPSS